MNVCLCDQVAEPNGALGILRGDLVYLTSSTCMAIEKKILLADAPLCFCWRITVDPNLFGVDGAFVEKRKTGPLWAGLHNLAAKKRQIRLVCFSSRSISSTSSDSFFMVASTGAEVLMSTPASFSRSSGYFELPPDR